MPQMIYTNCGLLEAHSALISTSQIGFNMSKVNHIRYIDLWLAHINVPVVRASWRSTCSLWFIYNNIILVTGQPYWSYWVSPQNTVTMDSILEFQRNGVGGACRSGFAKERGVLCVKFWNTRRHWTCWLILLSKVFCTCRLIGQELVQTMIHEHRFTQTSNSKLVQAKTAGNCCLLENYSCSS